MPSSDDPRWERWGEEVEKYLERNPMSAKELLHALPNYSLALVVNTLSWLSMFGRIVREGKKPARWRVAPRVVELPPPPKCLKCGGPWTQSMTGIICLFCGTSRTQPKLSEVPAPEEDSSLDLGELNWKHEDD